MRRRSILPLRPWVVLAAFIVSQGEVANGFYVLASGRTLMIKKTEPGEELSLNL